MVHGVNEEFADGHDRDGERTLFVISEDADNNLLAVEGDGVVNIVERRAEVLRETLCRCFTALFMQFPCCIVWRKMFSSEKGDKNRDEAEEMDDSISYLAHTPSIMHDFTDSSATRKRVWPRGFGPGWFIRTFCPVVLLFWCLVLLDGIYNGLDLFNHLSGTITPPHGSSAARAIEAFKDGFFLVSAEAFPTNTMLIIERKDGSSVLTPEVELFCKTLKSALMCDGDVKAHKCQNDLNFLWGINTYKGYYMFDKEFEREATEVVYVNGVESATMVYIQHTLSAGLHTLNNFFDYLVQFIETNGPNPVLYDVRFTNEQRLLKIAQDEVIYDFEHADLIGIPFAWVILLWYCGIPAFLVLISLPICILSSFSWSVQWMPDRLKLPTFAPSMIVSMAVALNVDYALFMLVRYSEEIARGAGRNFALDKAMSTAGKTIAVSGSIMLVSNGCLYFVKAETVASLGLSLAITNLITICTNLTLLPALLCMFGAAFDKTRQIKRPGCSTLFPLITSMVLAPFVWLFNAVFGSGKKRKGVKIVQHHTEAATGETHPVGRFDDLDEEEHNELLLEAEESGTESMPSTPGAHSFDEGSDNQMANGVSVDVLPVASFPRSAASIGDAEQQQAAEGGRLLQTQNTSRRRLRNFSEASFRKPSAKTTISAQSRVWAAIANLCLNYPTAVVIVVFAFCAPVCWQVLRFEWTDSQANLVPQKNEYVSTVRRIGELGFAEGFLADYKAIIASPLDPSSSYILLKEYCFDNDMGFRILAKEVHHRIPDLPDLPYNVTCSMFVDGTIGTSCDGYGFSSLLKNWCPYSCNSCRVELLQSKQFFEKGILAAETILETTRKYSTINSTAISRDGQYEAMVIESVTSFLGRHYTWRMARSLLSARHMRPRNQDAIDRMYVERFHHLVSYNATEMLFRIRTPFQPFDRLAHPWADDIKQSLVDVGYITSELYGANDDRSSFRYFFGGTLPCLFDQVDQVFADTPPVMITAVVLTVLGTSVMVFQSLLLGPRLLVTIFLTLGLVFGFMVMIFQDLHASPESAGLYWIVPILGIPVMVGCTLDYDSFVVARIFEMRLAGMSTEAAVFAGLQETGHVITIAGVIMTVAFGSMVLSAIPVVQQIGALLVACCLLDTFIIRSLLVPSLMLVAVDKNWYPKQMPEVHITMDMLREAASRRMSGKSRRNSINSSSDVMEGATENGATGASINHETSHSLQGEDTRSVSAYSASTSRSRPSSVNDSTSEGKRWPLPDSMVEPENTTVKNRLRSNSGGSWASLE